MKIAFVTPYPVKSQAPCGGVEAVNVNLVKALSAFDDLDIHVVTTDPSVGQVVLKRENRVTVHRLPEKRKRLLFYAVGPGRAQMQEYIKTLKPDLVHSHDVYGIMVKGLRMPRVFTVHGFIYLDTLASGRDIAGLRSRLWKMAEESAWRDHKHIISINPYVREHLQKVVNAEIYDINNPVSAEFFQVPRNEKKGFIFSSAAVCRRKNTRFLTEAFEKLVERGTGAELRLAGPVQDEGYMRGILDFVEDKRIADRVRFLGMIDSNKVREELSTASVYALVSLEENAPMGIEEAMAAGVPVVASRRCGMPYMVEDGRSGFLVDPADKDEVVRAFERLLADDSLRRAMGEASREIALKNFHPARIAENIREVYHKVVAGGMSG